MSQSIRNRRWEDQALETEWRRARQMAREAGSHLPGSSFVRQSNVRYVGRARSPFHQRSKRRSGDCNNSSDSIGKNNNSNESSNSNTTTTNNRSGNNSITNNSSVESCGPGQPSRQGRSPAHPCRFVLADLSWRSMAHGTVLSCPTTTRGMVQGHGAGIRTASQGHGAEIRTATR